MNKYWQLNRLMVMTKNLWFKHLEIYVKHNQVVTTINSLEQELFALEKREEEAEMPDTGHVF